MENRATIPVRPMQIDDVPAACALLNQIIDVGGTTAFETPFEHAGFADAFLYRPGLICCHVALDAGSRVAGFQWLGRNDKLPDACADIATFARLDPVLRGVGTALFAATCHRARELGFDQINATIRADNAPGLGYYSKMGFVDHAVNPAVPLSDGTLIDRISKRFSLG